MLKSLLSFTLFNKSYLLPLVCLISIVVFPQYQRFVLTLTDCQAITHVYTRRIHVETASHPTSCSEQLVTSMKTMNKSLLRHYSSYCSGTTLHELQKYFIHTLLRKLHIKHVKSIYCQIWYVLLQQSVSKQIKTSQNLAQVASSTKR